MTSTISTFTFKNLKELVSSKFKTMTNLFYIDVDKDEIWDQYLSGFSDDKRQEHNCGSCRSFLRQFGSIVSIDEDYNVVSLWDGIEVSDEYKQSVDNLNSYIKSRPVTDIFLSSIKKCGVDKNLDPKTAITWNHFYIELPSSTVVKDVSPKQAQARDDKSVLKRSLDEITLDATETVLDLIAQNSLYRGKEFESVLKKFVLLQRQYKKVTQKDNFCWIKSKEAGSQLSRIKNSAIGTLLVDLSEGLDLDTAVAKFEKVMAPANYKRPTALVTPKMVEQAKEKMQSLGLMESLERRFANDTDLRVCDILFTDKASNTTDVFGQIAKETTINPKTLSKLDEIGIEDFIKNVVPNAKSISILLENKHLGNFVSLITAQNPEAPSLFKWGNHISWSYTGSVTDSIKERVKEAGGRVDGELRTSLSWFNYDDLDLHVIEPNGNQIYYSRRLSGTSGYLDVDMNAGMRQSRNPVENIIWTNKSSMREGTYTVMVNNFSKRESIDSGFIVQIECGGETFDFEFNKNPSQSATINVVKFNYSKNSGVTIEGDTKSSVVSKDKWGLKTSQFHKVTKLLLSPNHWDKVVGNKHYMFMLEGCETDESPRPFFNEFLKPELDEHRKVFEILGSKVSVENTGSQLSGLGFSETNKSAIIVKVEGKFTRMLKVNIG